MKTQSRKAILAVLAALLCAPLAAQQKAADSAAAKRAMTFLDVLELRSVGNGSVSPDGKWVLYTVSIPQWKAGRNYTDIFLAPADGSAPPRQMTFTKEKSESNPRWARDSKSFAFTADRGDRTQVFLMRIDGGEARQISEARDGVTAYAFSRDGKWLAFLAGKPEERQIWVADLSKEAPPVQLTKHATPVSSVQWSYDSSQIFFLAPDRFDKDDVRRREKKFDVRIADEPIVPSHLWSVSLADKAEKRWTSGEKMNLVQYTLSDDGRWAAFRATTGDRHANRLTQDDAELYLLSLSGSAEPRRLTRNNVGEGAARFSPDSKWLAFTANEDFTNMRNSKIYVLAVGDPPGEMKKLLGGWDYSAGGIDWSRDSRQIYFGAGVGTERHLYAVNIADGKWTQLTKERGVVGGGYDDETGLFLLTFSDPTQPSDYYVARAETLAQRSRWVRASNANPQVAAFQLGETEVVRWKSSDGAMVEGILVKPVGWKAGQRAPLVVQVHGGPAAADMFGFAAGYGSYVHIFAANGYAILKPNYRGSDNYGEKFRTQISGDYFRQAYDDIIAGVDHLIAQGIADPDKLGMMGWSAGGHWSNWTMTQTNRFKAFSSGAGAVNWISMYAQTDVQTPREFYFKGKPYDNWEHYVAVSPLKYIKNAKTPTLIHVCDGDPRVPKPQSDELHMALKKLGVPVEYIVYPQNSHGITDPRYQMVKMVAEFNWFEKWIKGKEGWFEWKSLLATLEEPKLEEKKSVGDGIEN
jgi:dipeptidyl aminopeptidase/acylaminoacyl peptidase